MFKSFFLSTIALFIMMQLFSSMADTHQWHQPSTKHVAIEHLHSPDITPELSITNEPSQLQHDDCHHCCHCHGVTVLFITFYQKVPENTLLSSLIIDYRFAAFSYQTPPDNPPPISLS